jgi:hypothetical protein
VKVILNIVLIVACCVLFAGCEKDNLPLPDLKESYNIRDKKPFGLFVLQEFIKEQNKGAAITVFTKPFNKFEDYYSSDKAWYVSVCNQFLVNADDASKLRTAIKNGLNAFIASSRFSDEFLSEFDLLYSSDDPKNNSGDSLRDTKVALTNTSNGYFYKPFTQSLLYEKSKSYRILGYNQNGTPNFVVIFIGKGKLFIHASPRAFSNYFLLSSNNQNYLQEAFKYLYTPPTKIFVDQYYQSQNFVNKNNDDKKVSFLGELSKLPGLNWAFWLLTVLMLLYIVSNIGRKQRVIPTIKPAENTTLSYTETMGRLYFQNQDNKGMATKMITYFNEFIRNKYQISTHSINTDYVNVLSRKSGVALTTVENLYKKINTLQNAITVSNTDLLHLNQLIQNFTKK